MNNKGRKRKYRNSLQAVEAGMRACWSNAGDLVRASQILIERGLHAPALSLSVLALEELGKLLATDGLLFADAAGSKAHRAAKSERDHSLKLSALPLLPLLVGNLARVDPRYRKDKTYTAQLVGSLEGFRTDWTVVMADLQGCDLDRWKQLGFYVEAGELPRDNIEPSFGKAMQQLAWRATSTLDLVLANGNLERYIENAKSLRAKLGETDHQEFERLGSELANELFGLDDEGH